MNLRKLYQHLDLYKKSFSRIHDLEIYKWEIIKKFQDNWNIDAVDFAEMVNRSLPNTQNLLDSQNYYPRKMLNTNAQSTPEEIRQLFKQLYDEESDLTERIDNYREKFKKLNSKNHPDKPNDYQDQRALMVYLTLRYPERYSFYKFDMLNEFCKKIDYPYTARKGSMDNIVQFMNLGELCKNIILQDQELIKMHNDRLTKNCYHDTDLNILTQDFIYAVVNHLDTIDSNESDGAEVVTWGKVEYANTNDLKGAEIECSLSPKVINFEENNRKNKEIGDFGELWVLEYERKILIEAGKNHLLERVQHVSKTKGDGMGFDILSFDLDESPKQIEVKTTKGNFNSLMYITRNELECSNKNPENYYLYRLYNFDFKNGSGDLKILKGSLDSLCTTPSTFLVKLQADDE